MKKYIVTFFLLMISVCSFAQITRTISGFEPTTGRPGYKYIDTITLLSNTTGKYLTGYGTWGSLADSVSGGSGWGLTGNSGTTWNTNFLGTTDGQSLYFKTNDSTRFKIDSIGNIAFNGPSDVDYKCSFWGAAQFAGNIYDTADAGFNLNPSFGGYEYELKSRVYANGSGQNERAVGRFTISPKDISGQVTSWGSSGKIAIGYYNDETSMLNINTVSGNTASFNLSQNGITRWIIQNTATNGDFRILNNATDVFNINNSTNNVSIGTTTGAPSAILQASSTTKGFLPPRMNTSQMNAISSPASGLIVYNTDTLAHFYYNGSSWANMTGAGGGSGVTTTGTQTLTNKRITARYGSTTSSATPTINTDNYDTYELTAQAVDITSFTTNLSGTPTTDQILHIIITGTAARAITWGASFEASTVALPTTTVSTDRLDVYFVYNNTTSKWRCGGVW